MPEPITYRAIRHLQAALQGIAISAGYHHTVAALAVKLDANQEVADLIGDQALRPFLILEVLPDAVEYFGGGSLRLVVPVTIHAVNEPATYADEARLLVFTQLCADVEQAVAVDPTRGGLVTDTVLKSQIFHDAPDGQQVWAITQYELRIHRAYGAPNG